MPKDFPRAPTSRELSPELRRWMGGAESAFNQAVTASDFSGDPNDSVVTGDYGDLLVNRDGTNPPFWVNTGPPTTWEQVAIGANSLLTSDNTWTGINDFDARVNFGARADFNGFTTFDSRVTFTGVVEVADDITINTRLGIGNPNTNSFQSFGLVVDEQDTPNGSPIVIGQANSVAHGMTDFAETNTYLHLRRGALNGRGRLDGFSEDQTALQFIGKGTGEDTVESTAARGTIELFASKKNGTNDQAVGANGNIVAVRNAGSTELIIKGNGDLFIHGIYDQFDDFDDVELLQAYTHCMDPSRTPSVKYTEADLVDARIIASLASNAAKPFFSLPTLMQVCVGAVRQVKAKNDTLKGALAALLDANPTLAGADEAKALLQEKTPDVRSDSVQS